MLEEINALPRPERQSAIQQRDGELDLSERGAKVRRHVVKALVIMGVGTRVFGGDPSKIGFQIGSNLGRRIFLHEQGG